MSNVLPLTARKQEVRNFRLRVLGVSAAVLALTGVVAIISLLPALISIRIAEGSVARAAAAASASIQEEQVQAQRAQTLIDGTLPLASATSSPTEALLFVLSEKPAALSMTGMTVTKDKIVLSGSSNNRAALNTYRDLLEASKRFDSVVVPVAALVGAQDGRFTVTLSGIK